MRIRKKKHLAERVEKVKDVMLIADTDEPNALLAAKNKKYFDYADLFGNDNPVEVEIGCGKGGFVAEKAKRNPNVNFFAVELLQNIAVMAAENIKNARLNNVKIFNCGADYLARYIKPESVRAVYLNFSPPFPGKRYENRRLTKPELVAFYKEILCDGGLIRQKTDDKDFFVYSYKTLEKSGFSVNTEEVCCSDNVETEYEKKFRNSGFNIYGLIAKK